MAEKILIVGSEGQVGTDLADTLRNRYGNDNVLCTDIKDINPKDHPGRYLQMNVLDNNGIKDVFSNFKPTMVYHLAAMLSATAEAHPKKGWELNMDGLFKIFDASLEHKVKRVFWPSSIAVFGPNTPKQNTPQDCIMDPNTIYGISKLAGERYCEYYFQKYNLDVRSIRYPGLIGWKARPGGGTTDYAVDIFYKALETAMYTCFLSGDTELPMMYMDDAVKATIDITEAPSEQVKIRSSYNIAAMSLTPEKLAAAIKKHIPNFEINYKIDHRQKIADSWPKSIQDQPARADWDWKNDFDIDKMVESMLLNLKRSLSI